MDSTIPIAGLPAVLGHEGAGIVVATGSGVSSTVAVKGEAVLLSINTCRNCANCRSGHPNYCDQGMGRNFSGRRVTDGSATIFVGNQDEGDNLPTQFDPLTPCFANFFGQSSFSRIAVVNQSCVVKVPGGLSPADLRLFAPLGCGISTGVGSVLNTLNVKEGSSVAVFGVGSVGLSAIMAARRLRHAGVVIAVDINPARLEVAKRLGATHVVDAGGGNADVVEQVRKHVAAASSTGADGVNFAVDATGSPTVIGTMLDCLAVRGRAAQVGLAAPDKTVPIKILQHLLRGQEYVGCAGGDCVPGEMIPYLVEQQRAGNFPLEEIVSYYDVKDHLKAFEDSRTGKAIKAVLCWS